MGFWELFFRLLVRRPGAAMGALYWQITRRRVRARNRLRLAAASLPLAYDLWMATMERKLDGESVPAGAAAATFAIIIDVAPDAEASDVAESLASVEGQGVPASELFLVTANSDPAHGAGVKVANFEAAVTQAKSDFLVPLRAGDRLSHQALARFAEFAAANPESMILFADEDRLDASGKRVTPWFKPRWNRELFLALDYLSSAVAIRADAARSAGGADPQSLLLSTTEKPGAEVVHVPHVLCHVKAGRHEDPTGRAATVARHLQPLGATCKPGPFGTVHVQWPLPDPPPLVSIIIPTRDQVELLRDCVESVLEKTTYPDLEVLVVDNGSTDASTLAYFSELERRPKVRVLPYDRPYNFAAINNHAAREAKGAYLCMLNNDTEVLDGEWLTEMMRHAVREDVGAVGAKLLYEDGTIQHAGVVIGIGQAAGHAHRNLADDQPGYFRLPHATHYVSAVTAACLVVDKRKYEEVDGLDEHKLAVAFNDVDFCLKLVKHGYSNVYVPHAVLLHHESKSRGSDAAPQNIERYLRELRVLQERWHTPTYEDPVHNPNLDRSSETFVVQI